MTTITAPTTTTTTETQSRSTTLWKTGTRAGVVAAAATTAVAAIGAGIDVPLEVDGEQIPLASFAQLTLFFTAIGVALAKALSRWAAKPQHTFIVTTVVLTALSIVPDLTISATTATQVVLIATHLVAAAIVVPAVARALPRAAR
jgi:peptidoglycan/LPS O-acetylase OafA/YrhL